MKKSLSVFSFALVTVVSITACDNDDDDKSRTDLLTEKGWALSKVQAQLQGQSDVLDITDEFREACATDNVISFTRDYKYKESIGADDCDGNEEAENGTWAWQDGEKKLAITIDGDTQAQEITTLDDNTLKTKSDLIDIDLNDDGVNDAKATVFFTLSAKR